MRQKQKNFQKGVDKQKKICYTIDCEPRGTQGLLVLFAGVAEQADARDLKSRDTKVSYRFDPGYRHHREKIAYRGVEQPGSSSGS